MRLLICSFILFSFFFTNSFAQSDEIVKLKEQHSQYLSDINKANKLLSSKTVSKKNTLNQLEILTSKINSQQELVETYQRGINLLDSQILTHTLLIDDLNKDIKLLRDNYAKLIIEANKMSQNNYNEFMLLFSSESFSEGYRRFQTLRQYSSYRKKQGELLDQTLSKQDSLISQQQIIRNEKQSVFNQLNAELLDMQKSVKNKRSFVSKLNTDEKWLRANIKSNIKKSKKLESEIEELILKESKNISSIPASDFIKFKGKLSWPVTDGIITSTFGEHNHPSLKGVKVKNNGIDITTNKDNEVRAIFSGTVSRVIAIPGYNKAVILRHGEYLTVYANLRDVNVKNGQSVVKNQNIGKIFSSSSDNNAILHFEVWEGSKKTNPVHWLSKNL